MDPGSLSPGGRERSDSAFGGCCWVLAFAKCGVTGFVGFFFLLSPPYLISFFSFFFFPPQLVASLCTLQRKGTDSQWRKGCPGDWPGLSFWVLGSPLLEAVPPCSQWAQHWLLLSPRDFISAELASSMSPGSAAIPPCRSKARCGLEGNTRWSFTWELWAVALQDALGNTGRHV